MARPNGREAPIRAISIAETGRFDRPATGFPPLFHEEPYRVEHAFIPAAVHRELAQTDLLGALLAIEWIKVPSVEQPLDEALLQDHTFQALGAGEQACIQLARTLPDSVLLISDNKARQFARSLGITVASIPAFLLACKMAGLVAQQEMAQIVQDLKNKDFYEIV